MAKALQGQLDIFGTDTPEALLRDLQIADFKDEEVELVVGDNSYYVRIGGVR